MKPHSLSGSKVYQIQYNPEVYLVFWGSKWKNSDTDSIVSRIQTTFGALAGTAYNNILSQYTDGTGHTGDYVHNDVKLMKTWLDTADNPPGDIDITDEVGAEEKAAVKHFGLPYGNMQKMHDVQVIIFPQSGTTYLGGSTAGCGEHYFDTTSGAAYAWVHYSTSYCEFTSYAAGNMAWSAVHEYAEMATDRIIQGHGLFHNLPPYNGYGWHTANTTVSPDEVADLCANWDIGNSDALNDLHSDGVVFSVPYLWSNQANKCVLTRK